MANTSSPKKATRKHLARLEREKKQKRILLYGIVIVLVAVVGVLGYGLLNEFVFKYNRPIAKVDGDTIQPQEFQTRVKFDRLQLIQQYQTNYQIYQYFQSDEQFADQFKQSLTTIQNQLATNTDALEAFGNNTLEQMINELVVQQEAATMGITVSEQEVEESLQAAFQYYPNGTPTPAPTAVIASTSTLSPTQLALVTATPTPTEIIVEETAEPTATPTAASGSEEETLPTEEPTPFPTSTPYTLEGYQTVLQNNLDELALYDIHEADLRSYFKSQLLTQKVYDVVTADVPTSEQQVWARHILVADKAIADLVLSELEKGEDWNALAAQYSQDDSNKDLGGDLGWFGRGQMVTEFEDAAFAMEIGEISEPVQTQFGWHIIQLLGKEDRPLSAQALETKKNEVFNTWVTEKRDAKTVEILDTWKDWVPSEPQIPSNLMVQ